MSKGIQFLFRKNKIDAIMGTGKVVAKGKIEVTNADGKKDVPANRVVLTDHDLALGDGCVLLRTPGHTSGNQTLFVHADEVTTAWDIVAPALADDLPVHEYAAGSWGPAAGDALIARGHEAWFNR